MGILSTTSCGYHGLRSTKAGNLMGGPGFWVVLGTYMRIERLVVDIMNEMIMQTSS